MQPFRSRSWSSNRSPLYCSSDSPIDWSITPQEPSRTITRSSRMLSNSAVGSGVLMVMQVSSRSWTGETIVVERGLWSIAGGGRLFGALV